MLAAYLFELTFVTVCYLSHILGPDAHKPKKSGGGSRKYDFLSSVVMTHDRAIKETMPSFLDAAAFFALSVGVATLVTALKNTNTYYEVVMLRHVSILSIGPLYAVLSFSYKTLRRKHLRSNIITITVILVFAGWWYAPSSRMWGGGKWTNFCFVGNTYIAISISTIEVSIIFTMTVSEGFGILLRLIRLVVKCCAPYSKYFAISSDNPSRSGIGRLCITLRDYSWGLVCPCFSGIFMFLRRYFFRWKLEGKSIWIVATFSLLVTWVEAAFVIFDRVRMQRQAGDAYQENLMGYGQVLAALIWVPVIVEYVYIAIFCKYIHLRTCTYNAEPKG